MAVKFEFYETPSPGQGEKDKRYHARVVSSDTVETEQIIRDINNACTLTSGDIKACLAELSRTLAERLRNGKRVHLDGLGYFQVTLQCDDSETTNPKTRANHVSFKSVKFRADKQLCNELRNLEVVRSDQRNHSSVISNETVDARLEEFFEHHHMITRRQLEELCQLTRTTAGRQLQRLTAEKKIENINTRNQPIYVKVKADKEGEVANKLNNKENE